MLKAGSRAADVYAAVSAALYGSRPATAATPRRPWHRPGHPEPPIFVPESEDVLMAGDVVTLEPGSYEKGVGGMRFEHNYLITETGAERLSNHRISLT